MYCYHCMSENKEGGKFCFHCGQSLSADSAPHHLKPGTVLNRKYLVGNVIGEGGFGITYIGRDLTLDIKIAIKEFYPNGYANRNNTLTNDVTLNYQNEGEYFKNGKENFLQEAQNIAKFSSEKGIVDVRDYFTENNTAYIIMEYIEGDTLAQKLREGSVMAPADTFRLMLPVMSALEKMHSEGIIHRDISPDNMMVTEDGKLKLMDFGSARYFSGAKKKTMSVMLKPGYAPYEQYSSEGNQGPWTDVYGLCATIYRSITGKLPANSLDRCRNDVLKKPSSLGVEISEQLENVLMSGLAVFPENRCQSMAELYRMTQDALQGKAFFTKTEPDASDLEYKTKYAEDIAGKSSNESKSIRPAKLESSVSETPKKPPVALIIAIAAVVLIAAGIAAFLFFRFSGNDDKAGEAPAAETAEITEEPAEEATDLPTESRPELVIMTDVRGKKLTDAAKELETLGLKVDTKFEESSEVAEGYVIRQGIEPKRELNKGNTVMLFVAKAPQKSETETSKPAENTDTNTGNVVLYCCASDFATLRDRASRTGLELAKITSRESVTYISSTGEFYCVSYKGTRGYVLKEFFSQDKNTPLNYGDGNAPLQSADTLYCCASDYATLRAGASRDSGELARISSREEVTYLGASSGEFLYVSYQGKKGYVLKDYFDTSPNAPLNYGSN